MNTKWTLGAIVATALLSSHTIAAGQADDWQIAMLNNPSVAQLKMEARGRVFIYDGLHEADINNAMDKQFDRVERMMFVRTQYAQKPEENQVPDDGCD